MKSVFLCIHSPVLHSLVIFCVLSVSAPVRATAASADQPNVVFFLVDDLGWSDLNCNGNAVYETPNVDRLSRQGMMFTDFSVAGPVCSPTRASIMTGKYPARTGITTYLISPDRVELYDLENDLGERNNLAKSQPEMTQRMLAILKRWQKEVDARFTEIEAAGRRA